LESNGTAVPVNSMHEAAGNIKVDVTRNIERSRALRLKLNLDIARYY
jgi:hypothetical protein